MKEYALLFRMDITTKEARPTKEQMKIYMKDWMDWMTSISDRGQLADGGNHFSREGIVLSSDKGLIQGPYVSEGKSLAGYILILAMDHEDARAIAQRCPILKGDNTSVEIREIADPRDQAG